MKRASVTRRRAIVSVASGVPLAAAALWPMATSANAPRGRYVVGTGTAAGTVYDTRTKLTWQQGASATSYMWTGSLGVCSNLPLDGGGWRQPTVGELSTLIDFQASGPPFIDTATFPGTPQDYFWSVTPSVAASQAFAVTFRTGVGNTFDRTMLGYVKCVR